MEHRVELVPAGPGALRTEHCHRIGPRPEREPRFHVAVMDRCLGRNLLRQHLGQEIVDFSSHDNLQYS